MIIVSFFAVFEILYDYNIGKIVIVLYNGKNFFLRKVDRNYE